MLHRTDDGTHIETMLCQDLQPDVTDRQMKVTWQHFMEQEAKCEAGLGPVADQSTLDRLDHPFPELRL